MKSFSLVLAAAVLTFVAAGCSSSSSGDGGTDGATPFDGGPGCFQGDGGNASSTHAVCDFDGGCGGDEICDLNLLCPVVGTTDGGADGGDGGFVAIPCVTSGDKHCHKLCESKSCAANEVCCTRSFSLGGEHSTTSSVCYGP